MPPRPKYGLGAQPSPPDPRDFKASPYRLQQILPDTYVIPEESLSAVRYQGDEGTCVGHATADGLMGYFVKQKGLDRTLSVRDAYQGGRSLESPPPPDTRQGTFPRTALKYLQKTGLCLEQDWPYVENLAGKELESANNNRPLNKAFSYAAVNPNSTADIKAAIMNNGPVLVCVPVYKEFYSPAGDGLIKMPGDLKVEPDGHHAIVIVGWDNTRQAWKIKNSWSTNWGIRGYAWVPYNYPIVEAWSIIPAILERLPEPEPVKPAAPWWIQWLLKLFGR